MAITIKQFDKPELLIYRSMHDPEYRPAWRDASIVEANLVLEGGSMRGIFTSGVLDFLMDEGLLPRHAIGASAGALNGYNYVAGARGRTCYLNAKYCNDWRYFSMRSFFLTGNALNFSFVYDELFHGLEPFDFDAFRESPLDLISICSNLETGQAEYIKITDPDAQFAYVQASASMPLVSQVVQVDGKLLLDGGLCDSVPIDYSLRTGVDKQVVVLTQDAGFVKQPSSIIPLMRQRYRGYPRFIESVEKRHEKYNEAYRFVEEQSKKGAVFLLRPPAPVDIGRMEHDPNKIYELYSVGYEEARRNFKALVRYLDA